MREVERWVFGALEALVRLSLDPDQQGNLYPDFADRPFELADETSTPLLTAPHDASEVGVPVLVRYLQEIDDICVERDKVSDSFFWSDEGIRRSEHWAEIRVLARRGLAEYEAMRTRMA